MALEGLLTGASGVAVGTGLATAGIAAAVPLAVSGLMALTPGAREERKLARKEREAAIRAVEKGEKYGFGPNRRKRDAEVARRMKLFNQDMASSEEDIKRKEAALGFGRAAALAPIREQRGKLRADTRGQTRGAVEAEARQIAQSNEVMARQRLANAAAAQAAKNKERLAFGMNVATSAIASGISAGVGKQQSIEAETRDDKKLLAMIAATGDQKMYDKFKADIATANTTTG